MLKVEVRSRVVGAVPSDEQPANLALDLLSETLTVRELITHTVEEQIRDLLINRKLDAENARRILQRQYLTESEISQQSLGGAVKHPGKKRQQPIDTGAEITRALNAFEQGVYIIVADGRQVEGLEEVITLSARSKITFLRLTPLVGG